MQLLQKVKDRIIDLTVLHGSRRLSPLLQLLRPLLHLLSRIDGRKEVVQRFCSFRGVRSSQALKRGKLCKNPGPHRLVRIIEGGLPALSGSNSSCKAVILETIHLVLRESGQAASKIPEHGFIGIIPASDFQCSADGLCQRILQNRTVCIQIHRNSHPCSTDPDVILISRQIAADNRKIPVMISLFGNQLMNLPEHLANLCRRIARKHQMNRKLRRVLPVCADRIAKQRFFQMCQGRVSRKAGRHRSTRLIPDIPVFFMRDPALPCHFADLSDGLPCQIEKILLLIGLSLHHAADRRSAVFRIVQRKNHLFGVLHQCKKNAVLHRSKAGKPVKNNNAPADQSGARNGLRKKVKRFFAGDIAVLPLLQKGLVQKLQIEKPCRKTALPSCCRTRRKVSCPLRGNPILHEFRNDRLDLRNHAGSLNAVSKNRQILPAARHQSPEKECFAHVVQNAPLVRTHLLKDAVRQTTEGKHVHIQNSAVLSRRQNHFLLCLHRVLIRHDHQKIHRKILPRQCVPRVLRHPLMKLTAFSGAGSTQTESITHGILSRPQSSALRPFSYLFILSQIPPSCTNCPIKKASPDLHTVQTRKRSVFRFFPANRCSFRARTAFLCLAVLLIPWRFSYALRFFFSASSAKFSP